MTARKFVSFLRSIVIILLQHKFLATHSANVSLKASTGKTTFTSVLKATEKEKI